MATTDLVALLYKDVPEGVECVTWWECGQSSYNMALSVGARLFELCLTYPKLSTRNPKSLVDGTWSVARRRDLEKAGWRDDASADSVTSYTSQQREDRSRGLSFVEREHASAAWSAELRAKIQASKEAEAKREHDSLVVDDDRWDID